MWKPGFLKSGHIWCLTLIYAPYVCIALAYAHVLSHSIRAMWINKYIHVAM